ncbi:MAG TPA: DUF3306 domain-containing protein [Ramlibacter sp.]|uniref:DUF3306 domain-containing protein n=1 Tax=Ramlibacter sp. TaxID=1917967 RepID=UPI002BF377AD|nr:DUF3306 domain-containing protein [Ramlibacter sp.]HVZ45450.1 DUF3306 domain-containing protein [Ramlibacter sp.]
MSDEGFLARWSRRKDAVREGKEVQAEPAAEPQPASVPASVPASQPSPAAADSAGKAREDGQAAVPLPTLEDVRSLTPESDFSRFVAAEVPEDVKNAAVRKLFSDPHFNRMDRLDVYIDDYSQPDPISPQMLKKMASAQVLRLFDEEETEPTAGREDADHALSQSVAQSGEQPHADSDLRLQPDDAPGPEGPGQRAE